MRTFANEIQRVFSLLLITAIAPPIAEYAYWNLLLPRFNPALLETSLLRVAAVFFRIKNGLTDAVFSWVSVGR